MEPSAENVTALSLEFEALAHADLTRISWERGQGTTRELVRVEVDAPERTMDRTIDVQTAVWRRVIERLLQSTLPEMSASHLIDEATQPEIQVPAGLSDIPPDVGGHVPDAPTAPVRQADPVSFLRCLVVISFDDVRRTSELRGEAAMTLYSHVYRYAAEHGVDLPH